MPKIREGAFQCPAHPSCKGVILVMNGNCYSNGYKDDWMVMHESTFLAGPEVRLTRGMRKRRKRERMHVREFMRRAGLPTPPALPTKAAAPTAMNVG